MRRRLRPLSVLLGLLLLGQAHVPASPEAAAVRHRRAADRLIDADRWGEAATYLEGVRAEGQTDLDLAMLLAETHAKRCDLDAARAIHEEVLGRDLLNPEAHAGLTLIALLEGDEAAALRASSLAISTPRGRRSDKAWRARCNALVEARRYGSAVRAAERAVRLGPDDARNYEALGRAAFRAQRIEQSREAYLRAVALDPERESANMALASGLLPIEGGKSWSYGSDGALFRQAVAAWEAGDLMRAGALFETLCERRPLNFKYRLGLGLVRRAIRRREDARAGELTRDLYLARPAPAAPGLSTYVTNWNELEEWERRVIRIAVAPARRYIRRLIEARASHEILDIHDSLPDAGHRRYLARRLTFDGRAYAQIRGVGGQHAATGVEALDSAAAFAFNTFAHEFAHQVLTYAFTRDQRAEVAALYDRALAERRCLDYYAASNVDEYFAQGYEALVSLRKRGCLSDTARHTRDELRRRDPALFAFLLKHLDLSYESAD